MGKLERQTNALSQEVTILLLSDLRHNGWGDLEYPHEVVTGYMVDLEQFVLLRYGSLRQWNLSTLMSV